MSMSTTPLYEKRRYRRNLSISRFLNLNQKERFLTRVNIKGGIVTIGDDKKTNYRVYRSGKVRFFRIEGSPLQMQILKIPHFAEKPESAQWITQTEILPILLKDFGISETDLDEFIRFYCLFKEPLNLIVVKPIA